MVLGFVIGPLLETAIRRSMIMSKGSFGIFFQRPIAALFMSAALFMLLSPLITKNRIGRRVIEKLEE
jgi:putative tricarboxylic transport membrane protein